MLPLFGPVPGGIEILVILLIAVVMFGLPLVLLGGGFYLFRRSKSDSAEADELAALCREVERLREEIERLEDEE
jgi:cell division protein FtsB